MNKLFKSITLATIIIIIIASSSVFAQTMTKYFFDGKDHEYKAEPISLQVGGEILDTDMPPIIFEERSVVPARAVFEKLGADISWDAGKAEVGISMKDTKILLKINNKTAVVNGAKHEMEIPAKIVNDRTMIPIRFVGETLGMKVGWDNQKRLIAIDKPKQEETKRDDIKIKSVNYEADSGGVRITVKSNSIIHKYSSFELDQNPRIVVDINDSILESENKTIEINNSKITKVRYAQNQTSPAITRVVVDLAEWVQYNVDLSEDKKELVIDFAISLGIVSGISFKEKGEKSTVDIRTDTNVRPNVFRLNNPDRVVMDIPLTKLGISEKDRKYNSHIVKSIRFGQLNDSTTRVVFDVEGQPQYEISEESNGISISFVEPSYKNIYYSNMGKPQLIIDSEKVSANYKEKKDVDGNKHIISVPLSEVELGTGRLHINDSHFEFIDFVKNVKTAMTDIIFNSKKSHSYTVSAQTSSNKTIINVASHDIAIVGQEDEGDIDNSDKNYDISIAPKAKDKIVVIDAGHGGKDPGAVVGKLYEKDLNLDISLRLYKLLRANGVKVLMTRKNDVFVELKERADFANNAGATLFVSVHNNAMPDPNYDGIMTLYYPSDYDASYGLTGKRFAEIMQKELVNKLKTTDRGLRERPNLVVLNRTKMPSVIVEVGFMTNESDRIKLKEDTFRQKAAEALLEGIVKALNESVVD